LIPLQYATLEGASIYQAGITLSVPTKVILPSENQPWSWDVTPTFAFAVSGSKEMLAGRGLYAGALTNVISYRSHGMTFTYGNYFSFFKGVTLSFGDYDFPSKVSQEIMKNGLRVSVPVQKRWLVEVYGIHTKFLEHAAVDSYFTIGADVGYQLTANRGGQEILLGYLSLGFYTEIGNHYDSGHIRLGSGWKF
jgi:hypothetical protein